MAFSPQNVKKMVTFFPVAAAPFASTNVARALSRSSLKRMNDFPSAEDCCFTASAAHAVAFSITTLYIPAEGEEDMNLLPVVRHHDSVKKI